MTTVVAKVESIDAWEMVSPEARSKTQYVAVLNIIDPVSLRGTLLSILSYSPFPIDSGFSKIGARLAFKIRDFDAHRGSSSKAGTRESKVEYFVYLDEVRDLTEIPRDTPLQPPTAGAEK